MQLANSVTMQHWIPLAIFFLLFAICGMKKKQGKGGCAPCHYIALGIVALVINSVVLLIANRVGYDQFNLVQLITLRQTAIESSFIVIGYGLMIMGLSFLIKNLVVQNPAGRTFL